MSQQWAVILKNHLLIEEHNYNVDNMSEKQHSHNAFPKYDAYHRSVFSN